MFLQGCKAAGRNYGLKERVFLSVQQRTHADHRADETHDIRNQSKFKLRICTDLTPQSELRANPEFNTFLDLFQCDFWLVIRDDFPSDSIRYSGLHAWPPISGSSKFQFRSRAKFLTDSEANADQKAPAEVVFAGSEFDRRGSQYEIRSGSLELG